MDNNWCRSICIIAEGNEEKYYLDRLVSFHLFGHPLISIDSIRNAHGISNVFPLFQSIYSSGRYNAIVIFCDGDNNSDQYQNLRYKINHELFGDEDVSSKILFYVNPVTLQVVLSHFGEVKLHNKGKPLNAPEVEKLTGIKEYKAKEEQIIAMTTLIRYQTYQDMKDRISKLPNDINKSPSTNILDLLKILEGNAMEALDDIIQVLNK